MIVRCGAVSLLCDPWFEGTCFRDGWGLQYHNPHAYQDAAACTHLWISHFHPDHLHMPTLRQLARQRADLPCLANVSANFSMSGVLGSAGFRDVRALAERRPMRLADGVTVTRFPSTGIDNMLLLRAGELSVLNFNDCNLPQAAIQRLRRSLGHVNVLLVNFNHANKLLDATPHEQIKPRLIQRFERIVRAVEPDHVIPFASMHYYRAPLTAWQNDFMLTSEELAAVERRVCALHMGDEASFRDGSQWLVRRLSPALPPVPRSAKQHNVSVAWHELLTVAHAYRAQLAAAFGPFAVLVPALRVWVEDLGRGLCLSVRAGVSELAAKRDTAHIAAHSLSVFDWLGRPYGTDALFVGGDFELISKDTRALQRTILAGLFVDNGLAPRQSLRMLAQLDGWRFFFNRREEILAVLRSGRVQAGNRS